MSITNKYHVSGMSCGGCARTVKNKLSAVPGVISVQVDVAKKEAQIVSSIGLNLDILREVLKSTHYTIAELSTA